MDAIRFAYPELRRMAPEALRMAGVPLPIADQVADQLIWTEVGVGHGLDRVIRAAAEGWSGQDRRIQLVDDRHIPVIDFHGISMLLVGVAVLDHLMAEAFAGRQAAILHDVADPQFFPYLCRRAAHRGYRVEAVVHNLPADCQREYWRGDTTTSTDVYVGVVRGSQYGRDAVARIGSRSTGSSELWHIVHTAERRVEEAKLGGIDIPRPVADAYTEIAKSIRLANSARSQEQAG